MEISACLETKEAVHRDIKPDNVIMNYDAQSNTILNATLVDWGLSCKYSNKMIFPSCTSLKLQGSINYFSPISFGLYSLVDTSMNVVESDVKDILTKVRACLRNNTDAKSRLLKDQAARLLKSSLHNNNNRQEAIEFFSHPKVESILLTFNDLWAIAITVFTMVVKSYPFNTSMFRNYDYTQIYQNLKNLPINQIKELLENNHLDDDTINVIIDILSFTDNLTNCRGKPFSYLTLLLGKDKFNKFLNQDRCVYAFDAENYF